MASTPPSKPPHVTYSDYLCIDPLLDLQRPISRQQGDEAFDETLFIITHQTYELWFKQILHELSGCLKLLRAPLVEETEMGWIVRRFERICEIQKVLIQQVDILETMTPLDFLDFRHLLAPASGFQSHQFRLIENTLGLRRGDRHSLSKNSYDTQLEKHHQKLVQEAETEPTLFDAIEQWLERTPFVDHHPEVQLWKDYEASVYALIQQEEALIHQHVYLTEEEKQKSLKSLEELKTNFQQILDPASYELLREQGSYRMSFKALRAALLIQLYRDIPVFQLPFRLLTLLMQIDESFSMWRYRHALMAHRMLGAKMGTGGSSGHAYLRQALEKHRVYSDLINLATFLIPRSRLKKINLSPAMYAGATKPL